MVDISHETPQQIDARLRYLTTQCRLTLYPKPHRFEEFPLCEFQIRANMHAVALVRDDTVWSQLIPSGIDGTELFAIWRFHFPKGVDNSGFVAWLATQLKEKFGTGVFVICGQNSNDGGIFDYWGCPWTLRDVIVSYVQTLVDGQN